MIYEKIYNIQQYLNAPKGQYNSFGKYKYRSCEDILEALKPHLWSQKLVIILSDEVKEIGGRVYVEATATAVDVETGETVAARASAREEDSKKGMDSSQVTGASSSYARKYALNGLFAIDDNKDSDSTNTGDAPKPKEAPDGYYYCQSCGNVITEFKSNGKVISQKDFAAQTLSRYGKQLCKDCAKKLKDEGKTA